MFNSAQKRRSVSISVCRCSFVLRLPSLPTADLRTWVCTVVCVVAYLTPLVTSAQTLWANGTQHGIELMWFPPRDGTLPERYTIARTAASSNRWTVIGSAIRKTTTNPTIEELIRNVIGADSSQRAKHIERLESAFITSPRMVSQALGTYFHDTTTIPLAEYNYQVWSGSTLVGTIYGVVSHERTLPPEPSWIRARQRDHCIELWWQTDSAWQRGIVGYALYRARERQSPLRIIKQPMSISTLQQDTLVSAFVRDCEGGNPGRIRYLVASIDVFGNEGRPNTCELVWNFPSLPSPTIERVTHGNSLVVHLRNVSTVVRPYIRPSNGTRWLQTQWKREDSALVVALPECTADMVAIALVQGSDSSVSWMSIPLTLPLYDTTAPERPTFIEYSHDGQRVTIRLIGTNDADVVGYALEQLHGMDTTIHVMPAGMTIEDTSTKSARYRVRAIDAHGNISPPSPWITGSSQTTDAPALVSVSPTPDGTVLMWETPPMTAYVAINRFDDDTVTMPRTIALISGTARRYVDRSRGAQHASYQIVAVDSSGRWSRPSERRSTRSDKGRCRAPAFDSTVYRNGAVILYWSEPQQCDLLLERSSMNGDEIIVLARVDSTTHHYVDDSIQPGGEYVYRLRCIGCTDTEASRFTITVPP